jgi:Stress up-regulated Nod 19
LPHAILGTESRAAERFFASGNERTIVDLSAHSLNGKQPGYWVGKEDKFRFIVDLMNMNMDDRVVYLTMTYDYIPGKLPDGWVNTKAVWLDVNQCGTSEVAASETERKFAIKSQPWISNIEGSVAWATGHLHDGGVNIELVTGDNNLACDSAAKYGEKPEYIYKTAGKMSNGDEIAEKHISSMSVCRFDGMSSYSIHKNQTWTLNGYYDYDKFKGNMAEGKPQDIMGIALMFVEAPAAGLPKPLH